MSSVTNSLWKKRQYFIKLRNLLHTWLPRTYVCFVSNMLHFLCSGVQSCCLEREWLSPLCSLSQNDCRVCCHDCSMGDTYCSSKYLHSDVHLLSSRVRFIYTSNRCGYSFFAIFRNDKNFSVYNADKFFRWVLVEAVLSPVQPFFSTVNSVLLAFFYRKLRHPALNMLKKMGTCNCNIEAGPK